MKYLYLLLIVIFNCICVYLSSLFSSGIPFYSALGLTFLSGIIIYLISKKNPKIKDWGFGLFWGSISTVVGILLWIQLVFHGGVC
jgi:hypothetical protein